jgi:hypothetical protein
MHIRHHRPAPAQHGILTDSRGQDQPLDKSRAQQTSVGEDCPGERAQRNAAAPWPASPGRPVVSSRRPAIRERTR